MTSRPGDWLCPTCNFTIWASKPSCKKCGHTRPLRPAPLGDLLANPLLNPDAPGGSNSASSSSLQKRPEKATLEDLTMQIQQLSSVVGELFAEVKRLREEQEANTQAHKRNKREIEEQRMRTRIDHADSYGSGEY